MMTHPNTRFIVWGYMMALSVLFLFSFALPPIASLAWINGLHSDFTDGFFSTITHLGNGAFLVPLVIILLFKKLYMPVALAFSAIAQGLLVLFLKRVIFFDAVRPIAFIETSSLHRVHGVEIHSSLSFPSGHAVTVFGICVFLSLCYRNVWFSMVLLAAAVLTGLSRVYLLQHFLMDVAFGGSIGFLTAWVAYHFFAGKSNPGWLNERLELNLSSKMGPGKSI
jgi:membrane-associated phospholipid phosphatase